MSFFITSIKNCKSTERWLDTLLQSSEQIFQTSTDFQIALPVNRLGCEGLFLDNPPIDSIDELLGLVESKQVSLGMISVPVSANIPLEIWGEETSNLNGWIDTAGYTGCHHIRFYIPNEEEPTHTMISFFKEAVVYALDIGITVSFLGFNDDFVLDMRSQITEDKLHLIGIEKKYSDFNEFIVSDEQNGIPIVLYSFLNRANVSIPSDFINHEKPTVIEI